MKLHDLRPADGSRKPRTRVGRGIAAGKGKTAGRGTKGQKARAGGSIPPWFEGGQTPLHMRIPKLRGFKNRFKVEYEVVNVGAIGALAERGAFETEATGGKAGKAAPITINQDILRAVGLVRTLNKPLKILGAGELSVAAVRRRRRVHRVGPGEDRGSRRQRQRPRGPDDAAGGPRRRRRRPTTPRTPTDAPPRPASARQADDAAGHADEPGRRRSGRGPPRPTKRRARPPSRRRRLAAEAAVTTTRSRPRRADEAATPAEPADATTRQARDRRDRDVEAAADDPEADDSTQRPTAERPPATTPDPCSNRSSMPSGRPTSGAGSSTSWAC